MTTDISLWTYIINAGFIVKLVMCLLFAASLASWSVIFERIFYYKKQWQDIHQFEKRFWSGIALDDLYEETKDKANNPDITHIFQAGIDAFSKLQSTGKHDRNAILEGTQRAMEISQAKANHQLEWPLSLLATIGSVSPYVGLFGTVWGIMTAFQALGTVQQASIAMVAPGISEALIATAIGLFAAIPAVIAYNRFNTQTTRLQNHYETFEAELINILHREIV